MGLWPCHILYWLQWLAIRLLRITVSKFLTNSIMYKTNNLWDCIDAHVQNGELNVSLALLLIKAANMLVTHNSKHIPFELPYLNYEKALTLCWRSVPNGSEIDNNHIAHKGGQTLIMWKCHSKPLDQTRCNTQDCWRSVDAQLMLCWRSDDTVLMLIFRWSDIEIDDIAYKGGQYPHYEQIPQHSP